MNNLYKIALRMAVIFIPIGILLIIVGVFTGAKKGVYIESGRIRLNEQKEYSYENFNYDGVKDINVNVSNAKIVVEKSSNDKFGVDVNLSSIVEDPTVGVEDGILKVEKNSDFGFSILSWDFNGLFNENSNVVIIYVPEGASLENVTLHTSNGRMELSDFVVQDMKASSSNGSITTNNIIVNESTSLTTSNGSIDMKGSFTETTYVKTSNGKIIGDGTFKGNTTFKTSNGSVTLKNSIKRSDCNIVADTSNGTIRVNDSKVGDDFEENKGASNSIDLSSSNGGITINLD